MNNTLPHDTDVTVEQAVLGAVLIAPELYPQLGAFLQAGDFLFVRHQYVWQAFDRLNERGEVIDPITTENELRDMQRLAEVGAHALYEFINATPTTAYAEFYARLVERAAVRRRLAHVADKIRTLSQDTQQSVEELVSQAETELFSVTEGRNTQDFMSLHDAVARYFDRLAEIMADGGQRTHMGVTTGFTRLDGLLGGLQRSDLLIFAGRPGMGKTSFMLSLALNCAQLMRSRVGIFTMEMGAEQILQRMLSMETRINMQQLRLGNLDDREQRQLLEVGARLSKLPIYIDDSPTLTPSQLRTKCRRLQHEHGLDLIIVDYLQLMGAGGNFQNNRVQEVSYISRYLKSVARELNVPLISAAQLSRAVESRADKRPMLSDLRESGSIEQDADIVIFLYRDAVYNEATENPNQADLIVAKHRNGPTDTVSLYFDPSTTKFVDGDRMRVDLSAL